MTPKEKDNPENFDDNLTQVAPKGEFKSGKMEDKIIEEICECGHKESSHNCYDEENEEFTEEYGCGVKGCTCEGFKQKSIREQKQ